jgi:hypothetical protein
MPREQSKRDAGLANAGMSHGSRPEFISTVIK